MKKIFAFIMLIGILQAKYYPNALFAYVSGVASNDTLSVRVKPDWRSKKITKLPPNAYVGVDKCIKLGRSNWCKVYDVNINLGQYHEYGNKLPGWVNAKYLKFKSRGFVAIYGNNHSCNYAIGCRMGSCKVVTNATLKKGEVVSIKTKNYPRRVLKGIGELDINSGSEGYACNRLGSKIDSYLANYNTSPKSRAKGFLQALESQNIYKIIKYIHPKYGITVTNKLSFSEVGAKNFSKDSFVKVYKRGRKLNWGSSYGRGEIVKKSLKTVLNHIIRPINQMSRVKHLNNLKGFSKFKNLLAYEFFWRGKGADASYSWQGAVVILAKHKAKWYVVGVLRDRWVV